MPPMEIKKNTLEELGRINTTEFKTLKKSPICLVLDSIRSLQNVGSLFRTGDAFRIDKIVLCGITGTPPNKEIEKTALGATKSVAFEYYKDILDALNQLKLEEWVIASLEQTNQSVKLQDFKPKPESKYAFVFGNEVFGVCQEALNLSDVIIEIPQFGTKHSFNVSVSAGIVLWDFYLKNTLYVL
jgi:23S rRNA (guanosine2251-2'-O)-methyltransferase